MNLFQMRVYALCFTFFESTVTLLKVIAFQSRTNCIDKRNTRLEVVQENAMVRRELIYPIERMNIIFEYGLVYCFLL